MLRLIADTVRTVRQREGFTLEDLALKTAVPTQTLSALECGETGITTTQLNSVAVALSLDPVALMSGREVSRRLPSVFLRHQPMQDFDDRDGVLLDEGIDQGRALADLHGMLAKPPLALQAATFQVREASADRPDAPAQDGYRLARDVRRWMGNVTEPLGDVRALAEERLGIAVVVSTLRSTRVTAVGLRSNDAGSIVLNHRDPQRAKNPLLARVYIAHELCHILFDPSPGGLHLVVDAAIDRKTDAAEKRARAFAAEFLLPREGIAKMAGESDRSAALDLVARVRSRFGTPHDIAANQLCNQGIILAGFRPWLEAEGTAFAGTPPATSLPAPDAPSSLVREYVERAHREGLLMDSEARATLGLDSLAPLPWDEVEL